LGNDGSVYILGKKLNRYIILAYTEKGAKCEEIKIEKRNRFFQDFALEIDENGNLMCAGFYADSQSDGIIGPFYMQIEISSQKIVKQDEKRFDENILRKFMNQRQRNKDDKGKDTRKGINHIRSFQKSI
jgi:hypothetical protein